MIPGGPYFLVDRVPDPGPFRLTGTEGTAELFWAQNKLIAATTERPPWQLELPPRRRPAADAFDAFGAGLEPEISTAAGVAATHGALRAQESADAGRVVLPWICGPWRGRAG